MNDEQFLVIPAMQVAKYYFAEITTLRYERLMLIRNVNMLADVLAETRLAKTECEQSRDAAWANCHQLNLALKGETDDGRDT